MNSIHSPTRFSIRIRISGLLFGILCALVFAPALERHARAASSATPIVEWSLEAQRAIVPAPAGVGNKFPGEAAVYMGIVHAAMFDAAVALAGGFRPRRH
jgi:hypothetical protein